MGINSHTFPTYLQPELNIVRGQGMHLFDADGQQYLDFTGGIAVNILGHTHPKLVEALNAQAEKLWHTSNLYSVAGQQKVARILCDHSFADNVFFTNSGAEAIECAIKTARRYHYTNGNPQRINILTFQGAFHGRTLATIAAGGQEKYLEGFGPKAPGFISLPFDDEDALNNAIDDQTAAILIEPIQGEGGIREVPAHTLRSLRNKCDENGILLIYDEIQTGIGRTGKLFAHEWANDKGRAEPDIMALAKGLGGGFPVGACLTTQTIAKVMTGGTHGTTFGGNPLAMAVAQQVLEIVTKPEFLDHVADQGKAMKQLLAEVVDQFPHLLEEVRGKGLLLGLKAKIPNTDIVNALLNEKLLAVPAGDNVVRFAPSLIVERDHLRQARDKLSTALQTLSNSQP